MSPSEVKAIAEARLARDQQILEELAKKIGEERAFLVGEITNVIMLARLGEPLPERSRISLVVALQQVVDLPIDELLEWLTRLGENRTIETAKTKES